MRSTDQAVLRAGVAIYIYGRKGSATPDKTGSRDRIDDAAIDPQRGTGCCRSLRRDGVDYDIGNLFGRGRPPDDRRWPGRLDKRLGGLFDRLTGLGRRLLQHILD